MPAYARSATLTLFRAGLCLVTIAAAGASDGIGQDKPATLAGTWKYSAQKSREEREGVLPDPTASRGMIRDRSSRSGTGVRVSDTDADLGPLAMYARPLPQVIIVQTDSTISVSDQGGQTRLYRIDGRKELVPVPGAEPMEVTVRLRGGKLTTERKFGKMGTVREVYSIRDEGSALVVEVRISTPNLIEPKSQTRIYDLIPKG